MLRAVKDKYDATLLLVYASSIFDISTIRASPITLMKPDEILIKTYAKTAMLNPSTHFESQNQARP